MLSPFPKKLKGTLKSFVASVASSAVSRRELSLAAPPAQHQWPGLSTASSKSQRTASKLLTAEYHNFFDADADTDAATASNETIVWLRESAELDNCWRAELLIELCPCNPGADPVLLDAFSLTDIERQPAKKKEGSTFDPLKNEHCFPLAYKPPSESSYFYLPSKYKPSDGQSGWSNLYRHIQRSGYQSGSQLVCRRTAGRTGGRCEVECFRSKLHYHPAGPPLLTTGFAEHAKAKTMRRSFAAENKSRTSRRGKKKGPEMKRGPKPGTKMLTSTKRPTTPDAQCSVRLVVFVDRELDRYYIKAGVGCNCHCKHPKLTLQDIVALSKTAPKKVQKTQRQLADVHGPVSVAQRLAAEQTDGLQYSRSAVMAWRKKKKSHLNDEQFCKEVADVNDDGTNEFINQLTENDDITAIFLYDDAGLGLGPKRKGIRYTVHKSDGSTDNGVISNEDCPESVKEQIDFVRSDSGKSTGRILLAAAWTTKEESARFKRAPEAVTWDVTEGTNRECRGLFLGLNYGSDMVSNVHTSVFIPSNQRWVFQWIAKIAIRKLHGDKTIDRIQMHVFDQAPTEYGPFLSHTSALLRLCWYHRGRQKTTAFKGLADTPAAKEAFEDFCLMCDAISDDVESEHEYELVLEHYRQ